MNHSKDSNNFTVNNKNYVPKMVCHHSGLVTCFRVKRNNRAKFVTISGAQKSEISQSLLNHSTLFLNCSDYEFRREILQFSNKRIANKFSHFLRQLDVIDISWRDGSAPPVPAMFWRELLNLARTKYENLVCFCVGGHGRTGTALSALRMVSERETAVEAVEFVRRNHCDESVETFPQAQYLADLQRALKIEVDNVETGRNILGETNNFQLENWKPKL